MKKRKISELSEEELIELNFNIQNEIDSLEETQNNVQNWLFQKQNPGINYNLIDTYI